MLPKLLPTIKQPIAVVVIVSAITGGLVGGVLGAVAAGVAGNNLWPFVAQSLGITSQTGKPGVSGGENARSQVVVEDSATIDAVSQAVRSVVSIVVKEDLSKLYNQTGPIGPFGDPFFFSSPFGFQSPPSGKQEVGGGTGFIITTDGMIVTNRHVVDSSDAEYTVLMNDGTKYGAAVLARDTVNDVAILKIQADTLPVLDLGDSDSIKIGQTVIAIGNSLGEFSNTVTKGVVSGINRKVVAGDSRGPSEVIEGAIQTDAAINPGNSGGPLLDLFGKVIGVNTAVSQEGQLIGFAIPINEVKSAIASVREFGRIVRPFLGVRYILISPEFAEANNITGVDHGALIVRGDARTDLAVVPGSPADKAGLVENDIILAVNGEAVTQDRGLAKALAAYKPGDTVALNVFRKGEEIEVSATLIEQQ